MRTTMKRARRIAACLLLASPGAVACTVTAYPLSFGAINPLIDGQRDSTTSLTVSCDTQTSYTISLAPGSGSYAQRTLLSGENALHYNLYTDAARSRIWGDGSGGTFTSNGSAGTTGVTHTIYGRIPAQRQAIPGTYSDTVLITVNY